jgi:hypothetical protein
MSIQAEENGAKMTELIDVSSLNGLWTRSLLVQPDGSRDTATSVAWLQGPSLYIDLRQPAGRPDFSHITSLADLTPADCAWLATQQGFAGTLRQDGAFFEWVRELDFQPPAGPDAGRLFWQGGILVETGRYADYLEHWHRAPTLLSPGGALRLLGPDGRPAMLVRTGGDFMFARARHPDMLLTGISLPECIAGAATLQAAQALLDCEISQGRITNGFWRITRSTLPFREGAILAADNRLASGWQILSREGGTGLQ